MSERVADDSGNQARNPQLAQELTEQAHKLIERGAQAGLLPNRAQDFEIEDERFSKLVHPNLHPAEAVERVNLPKERGLEVHLGTDGSWQHEVGAYAAKGSDTVEARRYERVNAAGFPLDANGTWERTTKIVADQFAGTVVGTIERQVLDPTHTRLIPLDTRPMTNNEAEAEARQIFSEVGDGMTRYEQSLAK